MSLIDLASLVLAPTATKEGKVYSAIPDTGDGDMTFTRGSAATRVNSAGLIEKERANLLLQSNTFDTTWTTASTNSSVTSGQNDPNGGSTAWLVTELTNGGSMRQSVSVTGVLTFSMYLKYNSGSVTAVSLFCTDNNQNAVFDLSAGSITSENNIIDASIQDIGGGWYRCSITLNASSASTMILFPNNGAGIGSCFAWNAQLEQGLVAQPYIPTTTTAVYEGITDDVPRVDYSGGGCPSLLLEPQRTNSFTSSEYFNNWILQTNVNLTHNAIESPEGLVNGVKYNISSNVQRAIDQNVTLSNGNTYTFSLYVKAIVDTTIRVRDNIGGWIEDIDVLAADGWQRITSTKTITSSSTQLGFFDNSGDSGDRFYFYGAMLEAGSYSTSYIPTYGVSSTRVADSCSKTGISELIGQTEGTMFAEFIMPPSGTLFTHYRLSGVGGLYNDSQNITLTATNTIRGWSFSGTAVQANIESGVYAEGTKVKVAYAYKANDFILYINGIQIGTDTSGSVPSMSEFLVGSYYPNTSLNVVNKTSQAILFPTRLTNDQLEELTK